MTTVEIPSSSAEITAEWLNQALAETGLTRGATISGFEREVIGEGVGFVGEVSRFSLHYDHSDTTAPRSLIAKLPTADEAIRNLAILFGFYEREIRFYEEMAGQIALRTPKRYYSAMDVPAGRFVLLLEDLDPARCGDQLASCSLDEAKLALTELAKFHAAWWNSPRLEDFGWMLTVADPLQRQVLQALYQQSWPAFVEQYSGQVPDAILDVGERFGASFVTLGEELSNGPQTIAHTDFRLDNMFFGIEDGGSSFAVIDWQLVQRSGGLFDVAYFLAGNFPPDVRRRYQSALLQTYHQTLLDNGVTSYDFEQCMEDYRAAALFLLIFLVTNREDFDVAKYGERAQTLFDTMFERYTTAILDLNSGEFLPG